MRKLATITLSTMLALSLAACGNTAQQEAADSNGTQTQESATVQESLPYDSYGLWTEPIEAWGGATLDETMAGMLASTGDWEEFKASANGEFMLDSLYAATHYASPDDKDNVAAWKERGMDLVLHDADDEAHVWVSLVPADIAEGEKLPVLFVWHGNGNALLVAQDYGQAAAAANRRWIVAIPWADNDDLYLEEFDRILAQLETDYNVDTTRIYTTGFSKGGRVSSYLALQRADVIAAAAPCGLNAAASFIDGDSELELTGPGPLTDEAFAAATQAIPVQYWSGEYDVFHGMPYDEPFKIDGVNRWLALYGIDHQQTLGEAGEDEVDQAIGLDFDETKTVAEADTTYHIGSFTNADGVAVFSIVEADGAAHWPTASMGEQAVSFLERFAKDPVSGLTVVSE